MTSTTSTIYTSFAFMSMATMVVSQLYKKKQTNIDCTNNFWNQCWKYIVTKQKYNESIHNILHADDDELFEPTLANITRVGTYNNIYNTLNINKPSYTVTNYVCQVIENRLKQILATKMAKKKKLFSQKHPLTIMVPLCGCSYDLYYISLLLQNKYKLSPNCFKIIGIESSTIAIRNFFRLNDMTSIESSYNPKYTRQSDFYRVAICTNLSYGIHIINADIFKYFDLVKHLKYIGIGDTPCVIKENSIDIIIDINSMSCIDPSDRKIYSNCMKYWLKDSGLMLLNTYSYNPKESNYPPFATHSNDVYQLFGKNKCKLVNEICINLNKIENNTIHQSWIINKCKC